MSPTVREALHQTRAALTSAGIEEAPLEAEVVLARALRRDRALLYASLPEAFPPGSEGILEELVRRRVRREPLAYVLGEREFYGLSFQVGPGVFIPRPETEVLVEEALRLAQRRSVDGEALIADVGTGSGAIAIALALHLPSARVIATDISGEALSTARANAEVCGVAHRVMFLEGDLLAPLPEPVDLIVANLPYVQSRRIPALAPEIRLYEPLQALDGGADGLDVVRRMVFQAPAYLRPGGALLLELDGEQVELARAAILAAFRHATVRCIPDLAGLPRCLVADSGTRVS